MTDKEYELCKEACKKEGCYCPKDYVFHSAIANTPPFIRAYFYLKGLKKGKEVLYNHYFKDFKNLMIIEECNCGGIKGKDWSHEVWCNLSGKGVKDE